MSAPDMIRLQNIQYAYHTLSGETKVFHNLSFGIKTGEFVAIVGPSGCGKSTLLSIIAGLLTPEAGTIITNLSDSTCRYPRIGYMLQHDHLLEWRTVYQNVTLGLEIQNKFTPDRLQLINQLLLEYGLDAFRDKHPSELSGGMKQRAALIRTLALDPQLLLLDEPFSALDYQTRLYVSNDICNLIRSTGKTVLLITHDLSEAISLADRVIVLSKRPTSVKTELEIHLTKTDDSMLAARNAPEFSTYFNQLWEVMSDEK